MKTTFFLFLSLLLSVAGLAQSEPFTMTQIGPAQSLNFPWEITYGPDGFLWITEREDGQVTRVDPVTGQQDVILTIANMYVNDRQDGLLGMALHPELGQGTGQDFVYLSHTYWQGSRKQKIVRYSYTLNPNGTGTLSSPLDLVIGLPASNDHNSGRLVFGPDQKLYYSIGDQGSNQGQNKCKEILAQTIPSLTQVNAGDFSNYPGKVLRINLDGSIPADNPEINGVRRLIYTYGHRTPQGLSFAKDGTLPAP
ncbi:MAG: PQQ-dependent sugar dehydrogenase, partial [Bacteroidia bacterium]|nr:PQQ-dependent sugar dehydrogenase [Bacteroidia bacterium]